MRGSFTGIALAVFLSWTGATTVIAQGTLLVPANQTRTINAAFRPLVLDAIVMEDNSQIVVSGIPGWRVQVARLKVGANCTIDLRGEGGNSKDADQRPPDHGGTADYCHEGSESPQGASGAPGDAGRFIFMIAGVESIGSLTFLTSGGNGGAGGPGGKGEKGGQARCLCSAGGGAQGGRGGSGGAGGDSSTVVFYWFPLPTGASPAGDNPGLQLQGGPGIGAKPSQGGPGGDGGDGACGRGHAGMGHPGDRSLKAPDGKTGQVDVRLIQPSEASALSATYPSLR
jgi:hypothetical protein